MTSYITFAVLGLGGGAVFASLAVALVVTHRGSGVINFAAGTNALFGAYAFAYFRKGELFVPIPGPASTVSLGGPLDAWLAAALALALAGVLGLIEFALVFRRLRDAPPLIRAAASIGVAVLLQASFAMQAGTNAVAVAPFFPSGSIDVAGGPVPVDRLWVTGCVLGLALGLTLLYRKTTFGLATEAVAESTVGAIATGLSPDALGAANWAVSGVVTAAGGILIAPIVPIVPLAYVGFIVAGLAAALAAQFRSVLVAAAVGLAIGVVQSELTYLSAHHSWLPRSGTQEAVPLLVILGVLLLRGNAIPARGGPLAQTVGLAPRPQRPGAVVIAATAAGAVMILATSGPYRGGLLLSIALAVVALSFVVITGYVGQASLAQLALAGAGAFLTSGLSYSWGVPFPFAPILAGVAVAGIGVVVGLPALRLRGLNVAIATLALATTLEAAWFRNPDLNGGLAGARVAAPRVFGLDLSIGLGRDFPRVGFCLACLVLLAAACWGVARLRLSQLGAAMLAVRANERSAAAAGVNVARTKVVAFAIASFIAGTGGGMLAYVRGGVSADSFGTFAGLALFALVLVAGTGSIGGALLAGLIGSGGLFYVVAAEHVEIGPWFNIGAGVALLATMVIAPDGITGLLHRKLLARTGRNRTGPRMTTSREALGLLRVDAGPCLLATDDLRVAYGGVVAVAGVSLQVHEGEVVGLVGPNGAGKTSVVDALSGLTASSGSVRLGDVDIAALPAHQRSRRGLARTFQALDLYDDLSVRENVDAGALRLDCYATERRAAVQAALDQLGLANSADARVAELSQGHRQLVSIARAVVGSPRVVMLDEPAAGLDSTESAWLGEQLSVLRQRRMAVLLIDHDMHLVRSVCDRVYVLDFGEMIASGAPDVVYADARVTRAYLGSPDAVAEAVS